MLTDPMLGLVYSRGGRFKRHTLSQTSPCLNGRPGNKHQLRARDSSSCEISRREVIAAVVYRPCLKEFYSPSALRETFPRGLCHGFHTGFLFRREYDIARPFEHAISASVKRRQVAVNRGPDFGNRSPCKASSSGSSA
jgi:hypothetical protein